MARLTHRYLRPDRFVCGTVGRPGERTFYIQAREDDQITTVRCDKEQVDVLVTHLERILDDLARLAPGLVDVPEAPDEPGDEEPLDLPLEEEFEAGAIAISWDNGAHRLVVEIFANSDDELMSQDPQLLLAASPEDAPDSLEVRLSPRQSREFVARGHQVISAGRPACPFCGQPISGESHICPRSNGYRRPLFL